MDSDVRIFSRPSHFGRDAKRASGIIDELSSIYRSKMIWNVSRMTRGSVALSQGRVLTRAMIDPCLLQVNAADIHVG